MIIDTPQRSQYVARAVLTDLEVKVAFVVLVRTADLHSTLSFWAQVFDECSAPTHRLIGFGHGAFAEIHRYSNLNAGCSSLPIRASPVTASGWYSGRDKCRRNERSHTDSRLSRLES